MSKDVRRAMQVAKSVMEKPAAKVEAARKLDRHPALDIPGTHIRNEVHGEPIFTGED